MIEGLKNCVFSICIAAIFGSIVYYILPEGSLSKLYKVVFGVFFLCCMLSPLLSTDFLSKDFNEIIISEEVQNNSTLSEIYSSTERDIEQKIKHEAAEILDAHGVIYSDIAVSINISDSGSINIERFEVISEEVLGKELFSEMERKIGAVPTQNKTE